MRACKSRGTAIIPPAKRDGQANGAWAGGYRNNCAILLKICLMELREERTEGVAAVGELPLLIFGELSGGEAEGGEEEEGVVAECGDGLYQSRVCAE